MGRPVTHWQIIARDPTRLSQFYANLFDWKISADNEFRYRTADTRSDRGIAGGFWPAAPDGRPLVQLFVDVDKLPEYVARAKDLGGVILVAPQVLPGGDEMAIILDLEGLPVGLMKAAKR
jgi:predicted enzyme related to lactoylglutathione lyase